MSKKSLTLQIEPRAATGTSNSRRLRHAEQVPAVIYGHGSAGLPVIVKAADLGEVLHHAGLITLEIAGNGTKSAILKEFQQHPISDQILHIDFQEVKADEVITSHARIEAIGTPAGLALGGQLEQMLHDVEIRCLPANMVEVIEFDVSALAIDDTMLVSDVTLPEGIELSVDDDTMIFQVRVPRIATDDEEGEEGEEGEEAAEGEETATEE